MKILKLMIEVDDKVYGTTAKISSTFNAICAADAMFFRTELKKM